MSNFSRETGAGGSRFLPGDKNARVKDNLSEFFDRWFQASPVIRKVT